MKFKITIYAADELTIYMVEADTIKDVLNFLKLHDHTGSQLRLEVIMENADSIYEFLNANIPFNGVTV
jgi:hypothetical protein